MLSPTALMLIGFLVGGVFGLTLSQKRLGCLSLILIPVGAFSYVAWWQNQHPELLRSTSCLEFLFVPIPPTLGALAGYGIVALTRALRA